MIKRSKLASLNSHELLCLNVSKEFVRADCISRFIGKKLLPVISDYLWLEINITEDVTRIDSLLSLQTA